MTEPSAASACALCGLPLGCRPISSTSAPERLFCCLGCRNVHDLLARRPGGAPANPRDSELFLASLAAGLVSRSSSAEPTEKSEGAMLGEEVVFRVDGMWCPACAWWLEEMLLRTEGVAGARVSFGADLARVRYLPQQTEPQRLRDCIAKLGYSAGLPEEPSGRTRERRAETLRLGVSAILTANLMMISMGLYGGFFADIEAAGFLALSLPQWVLATPVVFYCGLPILRRARGSLRFGGASMDTLIAAGSLAAYSYSVAALAAGSLHLYFDTAAALITLTLLGRAVEGRARDRVRREGAEFCGWERRKARLFAEGEERWVPVAAVRIGDTVIVRAAEPVPVDGRVVRGRGRVDESTLTGEARPVRKEEGADVPGGAVLLEGELRLRALREASESAVGRVAALVEEALARKAPAELFADGVTRRLVPGVFVLASATALFLGLRGESADQAMLRALSVLVVTCPCALGIAAPLAKVAALGVGRTRGVLIRNPEALERVPGLDVLLLDKTGTVTEGSFELRDVFTDGVTREEALRRAAAVESRSSHLLAREVLRRAPSGPAEDVTDFAEADGLGVSGVVQGESITVGNRRWMDSHGLPVPSELEAKQRSVELEGLTTAFVGWGSRARALLAFGDAQKAGSAGVVRALQSRGLELCLVSGDSAGAAAAAARSLGIERFVGDALPAQKAELVRKLKAQGRRVGMVGDGLNDAAALAEADVGFSFGAGADFPQRAADVLILGREPERLLDALELTSLAARVARQNLQLAFAYNVVAVPVALCGLLTPIFAALAMLCSSLAVVGNTLRISRARRGVPPRSSER